MAVTLSLCWPRVRDEFPKLRKCKRYPHPFRRIPAAKLNRLAAIRMSELLAVVHLDMNSRIEFRYKQKDIVAEYLEHNQLLCASSCAAVHKKLPPFMELI
jgi:hypothetical protein